MNVRAILVLRLADLDTARGAPPGSLVRVDLGDARQLSMAQMERLAYLTYSAAHVQIEGTCCATAEQTAAYVDRYNALQAAI